MAVVVAPVLAHQVEPPQSVVASSQAVTATGTVAELTVHTLGGEELRYFGLKLDLGDTYALNGSGLDTLSRGLHVSATGTVAGKVFSVYFIADPQGGSQARTAAKSLVRRTITGTLAVYHKDFFDEGRGEFGLAVGDASGQMTLLNVVTIPDSLQIGMQVTVDGTLALDGSSLDVETISVVALPPARLDTVAGAPITNTVLVIPIRFSDNGGDPFNSGQVDTEFQTRVAPYYQEVSYGQQLLNISVACATPPVPAQCAGKTDANGWLQSASTTPASCDFTQMGILANAAATAAGYDTTTSSHKFVYYVLPSISSCGWAGLAYVGYSWQAWSNGYNALWVYGHELGHNFGLWHAGSVDCGAQVITTGCSVSEYGDPFDLMGNIRQMHFNSMQKLRLGWIPASSVKAHTTGTQTYVLSPIETGGQPVYAVTVQASTTRKYWVEFRQPIGFDAPLASLPNLGAQVRVSAPFESSSGSDDTQLLDMTPGSGGGFDDAALMQGLSYTDSTYGITLHVNSANASALSLTVTTAGATPPAALQSAVSRKLHGTTGTFNMPLTLTPLTNPSTEPRQGPAQTIVFTFNKPIAGATAAVTEGVATAAAPTFSGNDVIVNLTGVTNAQYVTVALTNISSSDGTTGGTGTVRVGFLAGDVNQSRAVTVSDVGLVNAAVAQLVTATNYLMDINASGTLTISDKGLANNFVTTVLPAP